MNKEITKGLKIMMIGSILVLSLIGCQNEKEVVTKTPSEGIVIEKEEDEKPEVVEEEEIVEVQIDETIFENNVLDVSESIDDGSITCIEANNDYVKYSYDTYPGLYIVLYSDDTGDILYDTSDEDNCDTGASSAGSTGLYMVYELLQMYTFDSADDYDHSLRLDMEVALGRLDGTVDDTIHFENSRSSFDLYRDSRPSLDGDTSKETYYTINFLNITKN